MTGQCVKSEDRGGNALLVVETFAMKTGLGWYINFSTSWSNCGCVFAIVGFFIALLYLLISICFKICDYVMKLQKGIVKW